MPPPALMPAMGAEMPDTPTHDTPLQPELRVTITVPLPTEPFAQAEVVAAIKPGIDTAHQMFTDAVRQLPLLAAGGSVSVETRIVRPKLTGTRKATPLAALAFLLLAACGVATTEPDCLREHPTCMVVESLDIDAGAGSESGGGSAQ